MHEVSVLLRKELRDAVRSRWLVSFGATFAGLALALAIVQSSAGSLSAQGFNRTTAGLINLCLLLVPLLALVLGAGSIAGERERGTLATLLSQPISPVQLALGKYLGLVAGVWMAIFLGFGTAGLLIALVSPVTDFGHYLLFAGLSAVLAAAMLSLGMLLSTFSDSRLKALSLGVVLWFFLVLLYDMGAVGLTLTLSSSGRFMVPVVLANPVECVRILAIMSVESDLNVLGPLGAYITEQVGQGTGVALLFGALAIWVAGPLAFALKILASRDT